MKRDTVATADDIDGTILVGNHRVLCAEVEAIVGEAGFKSTAATIVYWKKTTVVTRTRRYVSKVNPSVKFQSWTSACPHAVGMRPDGSIVMPRVETEAGDPLELFSKAMAAIRREMGRQCLKNLFSGIVLLLLAILSIALFVVINGKQVKHPNFYSPLIWGTLLFIAGGLAMGRFFFLIHRRGRIVRLIRRLREHGDIDTELLQEAVLPVPPEKRAGVLPAFFAVVAAVLMVVPILGPIMAIIAVARTIRRKTWARRLALIALVISLAITAFVMLK